MINLKCGDCIELMKEIPDKSIDMVLCDLPYGVTANKWDVVIPIDDMWKQYKRIVKTGGAIVLFSQMPFTAVLVNSNKKMFRYEWIWEKTSAVGFFNARKMPLKAHENILVFYDKLPTYNPQMTEGTPYKKKRSGTSENYENFERTSTNNESGQRFPRSVLRISNGYKVGQLHPTQKPLELCEYLINTYTNEGDLVLDNCMGSGTTGVACKNLGRDFIGIELDENYFNIAKERIESV